MTTTTADHDSGTRSLALGAAAGLAVGLAANFVRKAVVQAPTVAAGDWDEALAGEHKAVLVLFDAVQATDAAQTAKRAILLMQMKHALTKHAVQEESAVYAALRDTGEVEAADHLNHDHGYVKQYLYDLTILPKDAAGWLPKVAEFRTMIERHMHDEEDRIFPAMKATLSPEANKALTVAMNKEGLKVA